MDCTQPSGRIFTAYIIIEGDIFKKRKKKLWKVIPGFSDALQQGNLSWCLVTLSKKIRNILPKFSKWENHFCRGSVNGVADSLAKLAAPMKTLFYTSLPDSISVLCLQEIQQQLGRDTSTSRSHNSEGYYG